MIHVLFFCVSSLLFSLWSANTNYSQKYISHGPLRSDLHGITEWIIYCSNLYVWNVSEMVEVDEGADNT